MQLQTDQIQVSLAVKTALSNGMVLLVNTEKRRLAVSLKDGSFQVSMMTSAVSGLSEAYLLDSPHALNDLSWHQVIIDCDQDECYASIDGAQTSVIKTVVAGYWAATENRGIYIGGGGGLTGSHDEAMTNFRGCIANLTLNKRDLLSEVNYSAEATSTK
ncbi:unnamed protein product [Soboliphyme baturini]|uniref:LAM_G_DOMAIN domain-containing protein n=1 Tax=Soboliphyme baturini TaxID=241478 RepID=A0A183IP96_9BILA|nr:unnamed protein product [Soboliphyme baturini]